MTVVSDLPQSRRIEGNPHVFVTRRLLPATEARMAELFEATFNTEDRPLTRDELVAAMKSNDVIVPTVTDRIDASMFEEAGERLGLVANFGAGIEHIDLGAARAHNVMVTNTPGVFTDDTADLTIALIISVVRRFPAGVRTLHTGHWEGWAPSQLLGNRIGGKRLGIVGMGRIGQAVAHRARAFGMEISYHNRRKLPESLENMLGARYEPDLDTLVSEADILTLHCPASTQTHNLIDARRIGLMKQGAAIVNTARGDLLDEDALVTAMEKGHIGGAGLDVFSREPTMDPRLLALPNVVAMPHLGSATIEGREASGELVIANIRFWVDGHRPPNQVLQGLV
jgi:glyoxylate reductase